jgi:hypothetical protein
MTKIIKALFISLTVIPYFGHCQNKNPINYKTSIEVITDDSVLINQLEKNNKREPFDSIKITDLTDDSEFCIKFPGGDLAFKDYILKNLKYPETTKKIEGKVFASFTINEKGEIGNIKIEKGLNDTFDNEVLRILSEMPNWIWDCKNQFNRHYLIKRWLPISFRIVEDEK